MQKKAKTKSTADSIDTSVGNRIRAIREGMGLSLGELSKLSKLDKKVISRTESGETSPSLRTLKQLANALNISIADLLAETDRKSILQSLDLALFRADLVDHISNLKKTLNEAERLLVGLDSITKPPAHSIPLNPSPSEPSKLEKPVFPTQIDLD